MSATVCWGSIRTRGCILYPGAGTVVLIRPASTFYERIILDQHQAYILLSLPVSAVFLGMMVVIFGFPLANKFVMHSQPCKCKG